jgi:hypothetical protein
MRVIERERMKESNGGEPICCFFYHGSCVINTTNKALDKSQIEITIILLLC